MMNMLKKLLKILLWLIGGGVLLIVLTLAGFYLYFAIPMQKNFAKLETVTSFDCATGDRWQMTTPLENHPSQLLGVFAEIDSHQSDLMLARELIEGLHHSQSEFTPRYAVGMLEIKRHYTTQKRLELAINHYHMGSKGSCHVFGMIAASQYYFGKTPQQLSIAEMALLVGLAGKANYFSPFEHPDRAQQGRDRILRQLLDKHLITEAEYQTALTEPLLTEPHRHHDQ